MRKTYIKKVLLREELEKPLIERIHGVVHKDAFNMNILRITVALRNPLKDFFDL